jgi:hypothetical protein
VYPKVPGLTHDEINNNNKHSLRTIQSVMAAKLTRLTHKIAPNGRGLYHSQFSLQEASPETFGYILVWLIFFKTDYKEIGWYGVRIGSN